MKINMTQTEANQIARLALDGDTRYSHYAVGVDDGDINDMAEALGGELVTASRCDSDVAIYNVAGEAVIVADANGPIAICAAC